MATKAKPIHIKVPLGVAVYPSLHKLDTEGKYPTNKYKTDILLEPADLAAFKADFKEKIKGLGVTKDDALPFKTDKDGRVLVRMKSKFMPSGYDSKNKPLPKGTDVGGGSELRCLCNIYKYDKGVTLQILQYQVKNLKVWEATYAFEEDEDGYVQEGEGGGFAEGYEENEGASNGDDLEI